jgi:hypothetical protein
MKAIEHLSVGGRCLLVVSSDELCTQTKIVVMECDFNIKISKALECAVDKTFSMST